MNEFEYKAFKAGMKDIEVIKQYVYIGDWDRIIYYNMFYKYKELILMETLEWPEEDDSVDGQYIIEQITEEIEFKIENIKSFKKNMNKDTEEATDYIEDITEKLMYTLRLMNYKKRNVINFKSAYKQIKKMINEGRSFNETYDNIMNKRGYKIQDVELFLKQGHQK